MTLGAASGGAPWVELRCRWPVALFRFLLGVLLLERVWADAIGRPWGDQGVLGEVGGVADSSTPHNIKLISLLDQEQLQQAPSREEIWTRRKSLLAGLEEDEGICPCLARIFRSAFSTLIGQLQRGSALIGR